MLSLREYQKQAVEAAWLDLCRKDNALISMSCGLGKTECAFGLIDKSIKANPNVRILFAVNKVELVKQTVRRAKEALPDVVIGTYCGSLDSKNIAQFTVASVQSLYKIKNLPKFHMIIFDEAHRINLNEGSQYQTIIKKAKSNNQNLKIVGLTATPFRNDGYIYGQDKLFDHVSYSKGIDWAIENGWLVKPKLKHVDKQIDTSTMRTRLGDFDPRDIKLATSKKEIIQDQIVDAMPRIEGRNKIIWHTANIEHAKLVQQALPEPSVIIHSKMPKQERETNLKLFKESAIRHLVFIMIVSEGFDEPCIDTVVLMRPTKSAVTYIQTIGRSLRLFPGKQDALILDYGEVIKNCGPLNDPVIPSGGGRSSLKTTVSMKFCPQCYEYLHSSAASCTACDYDFIKAKLSEQKAYLEKLSLHPDEESKLIRSQKDFSNLSWVEIEPERSKADIHQSQAGNTCVRLSFHQKGHLYKKYYKYVVVESSNIFSAQTAYATLNSLMKGRLSKFDKAIDYVSCINKIGFSHINAILVDHSGKWPEIKKYRYNEEPKLRRTQVH